MTTLSEIVRRYLSRQWILSFFLCLCLCDSAVAGSIHDDKGRLLINIRTSGDVGMPNGASLGQFRPDGSYINRRGSVILRLARDGSVYNQSGKLIAKFESGQRVLRTPSGTTIGRIDNDGAIKDRQGRLLATSDDVPPAWAAIYWFLLH